MFNLANCCFFEGRISRDPQFSQVQMGVGQNGQPNMVDKALFSIAVDRALSSQQRQKAKNGDQSIKTVDFISCSLIELNLILLVLLCLFSYNNLPNLKIFSSSPLISLLFG